MANSAGAAFARGNMPKISLTHSPISNFDPFPVCSSEFQAEIRIQLIQIFRLSIRCSQRAFYYGVIDDSGSLNAIVLHEKIALQISKKISLAPDNFFFWRQRTTDGLYSQPGVLLRSGLASQKKYLGALQDIAITWRVDHHTTVQLLGAYYETGAFLRETSPPGRNTAYVSGKVIYRF